MTKEKTPTRARIPKEQVTEARIELRNKTLKTIVPELAPSIISRLDSLDSLSAREIVALQLQMDLFDE